MNPFDFIMSRAGAFMQSRTILSAAELDLFTYLQHRPVTAAELAADRNLDERALTRLLDCLTTLDLLKKTAGRYTPTEEGLLISSDHPDSLLPMVLHHNSIWDNWSNLTATLRQGANPELKQILGSDNQKETEAFIGAMHVIGKKMAGDIAAGCSLGAYKKLLDIGVGSGIYTIAFLKENPRMEAIVFDFESVIPITAKWIESEGLGSRVSLHCGDFYTDELPGGCDLALLSAIIHQNSPDENIALFKKIHSALEPGGTLLIRDHIMDDDRTSPPLGAMFALVMLVNTPSGDTYTFDEVRNMLQKAGFDKAALIRSGENMDCVVKARKM